MATKKVSSAKISKSNRASKSVKTVRKEAPKASAVGDIESPQTEEKQNDRKFPQIPLSRNKVILLLSVIILIGVLFLLRSLLIAATVNGEPIYRWSVVSELEKRAGKQVVTSMVTKTLILQEARKRNVSVSDSEVDREMKSIEDNLTKQGQSLDQILLMQGMSKSDFKEQVMLQKLVEKMLDIKVSDAEVNKYLEDNKETLPADTKPEELKASAREQVKQQKFQEKFQTWMQDLQKKAQINYLVSY